MVIHTVLKIIYIDDVIFLKAIKGDNKTSGSIKNITAKKIFFLPQQRNSNNFKSFERYH